MGGAQEQPIVSLPPFFHPIPPLTRTPPPSRSQARQLLRAVASLAIDFALVSGLHPRGRHWLVLLLKFQFR